MPDVAISRTSAMEFLLSNKGYLLEENVKIRAQNLSQRAVNVVDESLHTFFMGEIPDLTQTKYKGDARAHVGAVLKSAAPAAK